jgi:hypothetical protein
MVFTAKNRTAQVKCVLEERQIHFRFLVVRLQNVFDVIAGVDPADDVQHAFDFLRSLMNLTAADRVLVFATFHPPMVDPRLVAVFGVKAHAGGAISKDYF